MSILNRADQRVSRPQVRQLVGDVLDSIDITDVVYYDFMFTRPLVEDLMFRIMNLAEPGSRVLVMGGSSLLCHSLLAAGYDLHLWRFGENLLTGELSGYIRGAVTPEAFRDGAFPFGDERYDVLLLPLVLEHLPAYPLSALRALRPYLRRDGVIVAATRNLAVLGTRMRLLRGKRILPEHRSDDVLFSINWPDLQAHRYYLREELEQSVAQAGYALVESEYVVGRTVYEADPLFGVGGWVSRWVKHLVKRSVPSLRDYIVMTLRHPTVEERRLGLVQSVEGDEPPEDPPEEYPTVTVVVPTHNRSQMLKDCFSGLLQQTYPRDRFDVVLINDGSTDNTDEVIVTLVAAAPFKIRYIRTSGLGAVGARNLGMREATGEIVAHLDDDNRPVPEWLEEAVRGFGTKEVAIVGGPVTPKPEQERTLFSFYPDYREDMGIYPTSNIFYRRELALAAGGFDESFGGSLLGRPITGWDSDLAWRLRRAGYSTRFRPGVIAYQEVEYQEFVQWLRDAWRVTTLPETVKRVPELGRHLLKYGVFTPGFNLRYDLVVLGVVLALVRRHPAPLLLAAPSAALNAYLFRNDLKSPQRLPRFGAEVAAMSLWQVIRLAALIRGSIQARRAVL